MNKRCIHIICITSISILTLVAFNYASKPPSLRDLYSKNPDQWPAPSIEGGIHWKELGPLPEPPAAASARIIELGKKLFFDPRLSGAGKLSCGSCHQPELSWTDGREKSLGHDEQLNKRNSPTIQNVWFYDKLFWDGRSHNLEDQAFAPINSESEMHGDMRTLPRQLKKITGYPELFESAFNEPGIDPDKIASALAAFQRTITSNESAFDRFVKGDYNALTDEQIKGLHIFRTKGKCINCHNGALLSDNKFHNNGFANGDAGRYTVTHDEPDRGKMKTPSLRDVTFTGPWMHDGKEKTLESVLIKYGKRKKDKAADAIIHSIRLNNSDQRHIIAFLKSVSAPPKPFIKPELP